MSPEQKEEIREEFYNHYPLHTEEYSLEDFADWWLAKLDSLICEEHQAWLENKRCIICGGEKEASETDNTCDQCWHNA